MRAYGGNGAEFTGEFGDIDETFYHSLESVLNELAQLLWVRAERCIPSSGSGFSGWQRSRKTSASQGYGDTVRDQVYRLEDELAGESPMQFRGNRIKADKLCARTFPKSC